MTEHIVALFETDSAADAAARDLENEGIAASAIRRYRPGTTGSSYSTTAETPSHGGGFWAWLLGEEDGIDAKRGMYPRDHEIYERGVSAGNAVLSVTVLDQAEADQAMTILDAHHPLQIDDGGSGLVADASVSPMPHVTPPGASPSSSLAGSATGEQIIPLKEEQVEVGKRMVDHGVTRVRRYVVETPVQRDVTLHGERVTIERRHPVGGVGAQGGAFEERTVEVRETEEVPVVEKMSRVVEEVAIRKEATERKETVRDTVRREQVEVTGNDDMTEKSRPNPPLR
jgi:uncharacterized protein (TIGR02271 family)